MNEVKKPKKPLIFYYGIVLLVILLFNFGNGSFKALDFGINA